MTTEAGPRVASSHARRGDQVLRVAVVGSQAWLEACAPPGNTGQLEIQRLHADGEQDLDRALLEATGFEPQVTVFFDPVAMPASVLASFPGVTLGLLVGASAPDGRAAASLQSLDRLVSFRPALTGAVAGGATIWRAIPPPVSDALFAEVRPLHSKPRAMTIGRSTSHREWMLMPAKHHHDLLQVVHGVTGDELVELLHAYDVGVYVPPRPGGGFGPQVGMHLSAGQLLLAETLAPEHGLERNIDYIHVGSDIELSWVLDRLSRFPEMHQRIRVRGRLKAEQYRASRLFARICHDVRADVSAFGRARARA